MEQEPTRRSNPENIFTCFGIDIETALTDSVIEDHQPGPIAHGEVTSKRGYKIRLERTETEIGSEFRIIKTMPADESGLIKGKTYRWGGGRAPSITRTKEYADPKSHAPHAFEGVDIDYRFDSSRLKEMGELIDEFNRLKKVSRQD